MVSSPPHFIEEVAISVDNPALPWLIEYTLADWVWYYHKTDLHIYFIL